MSISTKSLLELSTLNLTTEQMAVVLNILAYELEPLERSRDSAAQRQKKARHASASRDDVTLFSRDDSEQKVASPLSPSFSPIPPITTPIPPTSKNTLSASAENLDFERFKAVYPKRAGNADWKSASKAFGPATKRENVETIISKAREYAEFCHATDKTNTEFVRQARTWLNANGWNESYELPTQRAAAVSKPNTIAAGFDLIRSALNAEEVAIREEEIRLGLSRASAQELPRLQEHAS